MADEKKIKYLMRYRQTQTPYSSDFKKSLKNSDTQRHTRIKAFSKKFIKNNSISFYNNFTIIVHRKKKFKLSTLNYDSIHPRKTLKRNSTTNLELTNNEKIIPTKYFASLQNLDNHRKKTIPYSQKYLTNPNFAKWDVYRCQFSTQEESCCCSCNSDAMFEVMKSLYDCYKKKNCDHCNCILCAHLPREERRLGELRKTGQTEVGTKEKKAKRHIMSKELLTLKQTKATDEKEASLKKTAISGTKKSEPESPSEKVLFEKEQTKQVTSELRSKSEKELLKKTGARAVSMKVPSEKIDKAEKDGLFTPLEGKTAEQKKKILRGLAMNGIPLPTAKTKSEKNLNDQVRIELGLPPEPKSESDKKKFKKAFAEGLIIPLEGKNPQEKEEILRKQAEIGLPLPKGRTSSEKALIIKIEQGIRPPTEYKVPSEKMLKAKVAGIVTPLSGKTPAQKENILRSLALNGLHLPEGKTETENKLISKVRIDLGLPPEPKTAAQRKQYRKAEASGLIIPLEGKTSQQKEDILRKQAEIGLPLPTGRTASEKALIVKVQQRTKPQPELRGTFPKGSPVEIESALKNVAIKEKRLAEAKTSKPKSRDQLLATGVVKQLEEKSKTEMKRKATSLSPEEIKKIDAKTGTKMKETKGPSDECICDLLTPQSEKDTSKLRASAEKVHKTKAADSSPVEKIPPEKLKAAKTAGLLTPLKGKSTKEKERIIKGLAEEGLPLPEWTTESEMKLIQKVTGLSDKDLMKKTKTEAGAIAIKSKAAVAKVTSEKLKAAKAAGLLTPLKGKSIKEKERIIKGLAKEGLPLPESTTESEKKLILKVTRLSEKDLMKKTKTETGLVAIKSKAEVSKVASEKLKAAKAAGLLTPLKGKSTKEKEKIIKSLAEEGLPLPEAKTESEKKIIQKFTEGKSKTEIKRKALSLPPEEIKKIDAKSATKMKESKGPSDECICDLLAPQSEKIAKAAYSLTHFREKSIEKKEGIKTKAGHITPVPVRGKSVAGKIPSEKLKAAKAAGLLTPLKGKSTKEKERIIKSLAKEGLPLPEPKTESEKKLIQKVTGLSEKGLMKKTKVEAEPAAVKSKAAVAKVASEKLKAAKAAGLLTPLKGKSIKEKERIIKGLAKEGLPLPESTTESEKKLIQKVTGLSEKDLMKKIKTETGLVTIKSKAEVSKVASEKLKSAKAAGLLTSLKGKSTKEKERIIKSLAEEGLPLPEPKTESEKKIIQKFTERKSKTEIKRKALSLPPEEIKKIDAKSATKMKESKGPSDECICDLLAPQSEKIAKAADSLTHSRERSIEKKEGIKTKAGHITPVAVGGKSAAGKIPSEKLKAAKAAGLLTPLKGKSTKEKERIIKSLAKEGLPLPEPKTESEMIFIQKVTGLSEKDLLKKTKTEAEPAAVKSKVAVAKVASEKLKAAKAAGLLTPLKGKSIKEKERIIKGLAKEGLPLPESTTESEKKLIQKVTGLSEKDLMKKTKTATGPIAVKSKAAVAKVASEKLKTAKDAGLLTPLKGKSTKEKERIIKSLAEEGLPLPEPKTESEKKIIQKFTEGKSKTEIKRKALSLPPEEIKKIDAKSATKMKESKGPSDECICDLLTSQSEKVASKPRETKTVSKTKLKEKAKKDMGSSVSRIPSEKLQQAKEAGLLTPLVGKSKAQKEKILKERIALGLPVSIGDTLSDKDLIKKVKAETGYKTPVAVRSKSAVAKITSEKFKTAKTAEGLTPVVEKKVEKVKKVKGLAEASLYLTEGKTSSEKALVEKVRARTGLPPEQISSEKQKKMKTKSRKTGVDKVKKSEIAVGVGKSKIGITEEFEDIVKTTTCDRGCGCDRKKIRFKHSYVKIRVTSPDISSLCPCPDECVPGVKGGVFTDNEGIKVTVGQVSGAPSFTSKEYTENKDKSSKEIYDLDDDCKNDKVLITSTSSDSALLFKKHTGVRKMDAKSSNQNKYKQVQSKNSNDCRHRLSETLIFIKSSDNFNDSNLSIDVPLLLDGIESSFFSSVSNLSILSNSISILSISVTDCSSNSAYLIERTLDYSSQSNESLTDAYSIGQEEFPGSMSVQSVPVYDRFEDEFGSNNILHDHPTILRLSAQNGKEIYFDELLSNKRNDYQKTREKVGNIISRILSKQSLSRPSSLYILLPTSSEENSNEHLYYDSDVSSTICIQDSKKPFPCRGCFEIFDRELQFRKQQKKRGLKISAKGKHEYTTKNCALQQLVDIKHTTPKRCNEVYTETTEDRPCCCNARHSEDNAPNTEIKNVVSEFVNPFIVTNAVSQDKVKFCDTTLGLSNDSYDYDVSFMKRKFADNQTPVRVCKIPPCSSFSCDHAPNNFENVQISNNLNLNHLLSSPKQCGCDLNKIKEILEKIEKDLVSKACGSSGEKIVTKTANEHEIVKPNLKKTNSQVRIKISVDCTSCGNPGSSQELKKQCPCEQYAMRNDTLVKKERKKSKKKKHKNHICDCPPPQQEEIDSVVGLDEDEIRRMKSVLTENTSGFKIAAIPKEPEPEMSLEEALSYVIQNDKEKYAKLLCVCPDNNEKKVSKKKKIDCECPVPEKVSEELKGIKLRLEGKGVTSKGLSGILCFDLLYD